MIDDRPLRIAQPDLFAALDTAFGARAGARLRRLDVGKKGKLQAELLVDGRPCWMGWDGAELVDLEPGRDRRVPLGRILRKHRDDGTFELLSYRPHRRLTLLDRRHAIPRVVKGFRKTRFEAVVRKYEIAHRALLGHGIQAPETVDIDPRHACLATTFDAGESLHLSLESLDRFHLIGEGLAAFQDASPDASLDDWSSADELDLLDRQADRHTLLGLEIAGRWWDLRAGLQAARQTLPEPQVGLCHRDFHDKQFIQHDRYLTVLDFDLLCRADVTLDAANFLAHVRLRQLQGLREATAASTHVCGKRFLEGLGRERETGFWERLRFYQATTFARLALLYALRPEWTGLVEPLTSMGHRCLADLRRVQAD